MISAARLVLASASPRRRELLALLGLPFDVRPVDIAEEFAQGNQPEIVARRLARQKAEAARLAETAAPILAADTIVVLEGVMLGKPADAAEARAMLGDLRGRTHEVFTAVALLPPGERSALIRHAVTQVTMREYTAEEVEASIARGDPFDKAGAYAIQDQAFRPAAAYLGCYCNVIGLPLWPVIEVLRKTGIAPVVRADHLLRECATCPLRPPDSA